MSNPSKAKGTACETAIVRYLRKNGFPFADRQPLRGGRDQGDITVCPGVIIESKSHKQPASGLPAAADLAEWQQQTELERLNARALIGILVVKRKGTTDPGRWLAWVTSWTIGHLLGSAPAPAAAVFDDVWVMLPLGQLVEIMRWAGYGDPLDVEEVAS